MTLRGWFVIVKISQGNGFSQRKCSGIRSFFFQSLVITVPNSKEAFAAALILRVKMVSQFIISYSRRIKLVCNSVENWVLCFVWALPQCLNILQLFCKAIPMVICSMLNISENHLHDQRIIAVHVCKVAAD